MTTATGAEDEADAARVATAFFDANSARFGKGVRIGSGQCGVTYRAHDLRRKIDVCVKVYKGTADPPGAERDWHITSTLKHKLIADTFAVETTGSPARSVVVARFIHGRSLKGVLDRLDQHSSDPHRDAVQDVLFRGVGSDICTALSAIHGAGFGHGDLHEGNVIVTPGATPGAAIIDFDNATFRRTPEESEQQRKESDVRATKRLLGCLTQGARWHEPLVELFQSCRTAEEFQRALDGAITAMTGTVCGVDAHPNVITYTDCFRFIAANSLVGAQFLPAFKRLLLRVAKDTNTQAALDEAQERMLERVKNDANYPEMRVDISVRHIGATALLESLVGD